MNGSNAIRSLLISSFLLVVLVGCSKKPVYHASHYKTKANAPFSDAVEVGNTLYLSGQIGLNHNTRTLVDGGIEAQTAQTMANIKEVLERYNSDLDKVVKVTVILKDINDFAAFNAIYETYFSNKPARTTFAASGLAMNALIEIDVIAVR